MKVAIVGGGMAGLGAAYEAAGKVEGVVIYERGAKLGGLAGSIRVGGAPLEMFYHHLFPTYKEFLGIAEEIGLKDEIFFRKAKSANYVDGRIFPFTTPLDLMRFKPLSIFERLRIGLVIAYLKLVRSPGQFEHVTAQEWLRQWSGPRAYDVLWRPLLESKFGRHVHRVGMVWFWSRIFERPSRFGYLDGGFQTLIDALTRHLIARGVVVRTEEPVDRIEVEGDGFKIHSSRGEEHFDQVIVAAPPEPFLKLAGCLLPEVYRGNIRDFCYTGTICMILVLREPLSSYYWTNIQDSSAPFVVIVEQTNFVPAQTYAGLHPVYLARYLEPSHTLYGLSDEAIYVQFLEQLKKVHPTFSAESIVEKYIFRAPFTQPVVPTNYASQRPVFEMPVGGLWWVSMSHIYPWDRGTDHSFRSGRDLARVMLNRYA